MNSKKEELPFTKERYEGVSLSQQGWLVGIAFRNEIMNLMDRLGLLNSSLSEFRIVKTNRGQKSNFVCLPKSFNRSKPRDEESSLFSSYTYEINCIVEKKIAEELQILEAKALKEKKWIVAQEYVKDETYKKISKAKEDQIRIRLKRIDRKLKRNKKIQQEYLLRCHRVLINCMEAIQQSPKISQEKAANLLHDFLFNKDGSENLFSSSHITGHILRGSPHLFRPVRDVTNEDILDYCTRIPPYMFYLFGAPNADAREFKRANPQVKKEFETLFPKFSAACVYYRYIASPMVAVDLRQPRKVLLREFDLWLQKKNIELIENEKNRGQYNDQLRHLNGQVTRFFYNYASELGSVCVTGSDQLFRAKHANYQLWSNWKVLPYYDWVLFERFHNRKYTFKYFLEEFEIAQHVVVENTKPVLINLRENEVFIGLLSESKDSTPPSKEKRHEENIHSFLKKKNSDYYELINKMSRNLRDQTAKPSIKSAPIEKQALPKLAKSFQAQLDTDEQRDQLITSVLLKIEKAKKPSRLKKR